MEFFVIVPASGSGIRFSSGIPKQFLKLRGREIITRTLSVFNSIKEINSIAVSVQEQYFGKLKSIIKNNDLKKVRYIVCGGKRRQDSVYNALLALDCRPSDRIIVHDAVRPFITKKFVKRLMEESIRCDCLVPGLPISDTVKRTDDRGYVSETVPRKNLWRIQTPQVFRYEALMESFSYAYSKKLEGTDEAALMEYAGFKVKIIHGETENNKITVKEDLYKR